MRSPKEENTRGAAESGWAASRAAKVSPPARSTNSLFPLLPRAAMPPPRGPLGSSRSHAASHAANRAISNRTLLAALSAVQRSNQRCTHAGARLLDGCTMRGPSTKPPSVRCAPPWNARRPRARGLLVRPKHRSRTTRFPVTSRTDYTRNERKNAPKLPRRKKHMKIVCCSL